MTVLEVLKLELLDRYGQSPTGWKEFAYPALSALSSIETLGSGRCRDLLRSEWTDSVPGLPVAADVAADVSDFRFRSKVIHEEAAADKQADAEPTVSGSDVAKSQGPIREMVSPARMRAARFLTQNGPATPKDIQKAAGLTAAQFHLHVRHCDWFEQAETGGLYDLTPKGTAEYEAEIVKLEQDDS
jgi:hypothetical protein